MGKNVDNSMFKRKKPFIPEMRTGSRRDSITKTLQRYIHDGYSSVRDGLQVEVSVYITAITLTFLNLYIGMGSALLSSWEIFFLCVFAIVYQLLTVWLTEGIFLILIWPIRLSATIGHLNRSIFFKMKIFEQKGQTPGFLFR
jgi:hypothetical protein